MALRRITMQQLYQMAKRDRKFFNALLRDPGKALAGKKVSLSPKNLQTFQRSLRRVYKISGKTFARSIVLDKPLIVQWPKMKTALKPWPRIPA
jgi:hypothetical protein